jgi:hypothetical protein
LVVQSPAELEKGGKKERKKERKKEKKKEKKSIIRNQERMTTTHLSSTCVIQFYSRDWAAFTFTLLPFFVRIHSGHKHSPLCHVTQVPKQFYGFICPIPFSGNQQFTSGDTSS